MNFLSHFRLAAHDDGWLIGALLGDFVKGPLRGGWPTTWEEGMRLHRRIDGVSDRLPARRAAAEDLPPTLRRYSGILLDIYGDYWLSRHWDTFCDEPLPMFTRRVYRLMAKHAAELPPAAQQFAARMVAHDLLGRYGEWETVERSLSRVGERLRRDNPLARSAPHLLARRTELDRCSEAVWRALEVDVATFRATRVSAAESDC